MRIVECSYEGSLDSRKVGYSKGRESRCEGIEYVAISWLGENVSLVRSH